MGPLAQELVAVLLELEKRLGAADAKHWRKWVSVSRHRIQIGDMSGARHLLDAYGGMGSFTDLYIQPSGQHERTFEELQAEAASRGGNAVVGIDLDYEVIGDTGSMLMVSASGTAVRI